MGKIAKSILMIRAGDSTNPELLERFQAKQLTLREMPNRVALSVGAQLHFL
jgi:hypothetical protein